MSAAAAGTAAIAFISTTATQMFSDPIPASMLTTFGIFFAVVALLMMLVVPVALFVLFLVGGFNLFYLAPMGVSYISIENLFGWDNFIVDFGCSMKYMIILIS